MSSQTRSSVKHILFIDPIKKLNPKKDTSLLMALTMKNLGLDVFLLLEEDFFLINQSKNILKVYQFEGEFENDGYYLKSFNLSSEKFLELSRSDVIHMRIDPPFDTRYLRYLWMLRFFTTKGLRVINSPDGILKFNEKLHAYSQKNSLETFVGSSVEGFTQFSELMRKNHRDLILKPLDLYQGYGVEKISLEDPLLIKKFNEKVLENKGAIVAQPFCPDVVNGEIRSIYFKGKELGSILKVPKSGEFLANIAQGAAFHAISLPTHVKNECDKISLELEKEGVDWIAYDILGEKVSEINITCPGLLVEVSYAHKKNLAKILIENL